MECRTRVNHKINWGFWMIMIVSIGPSIVITNVPLCAEWMLIMGKLFICVGRCVRAKSLQSFLTGCNPMDCSLPGFSVYRILQARILEWVSMPFSRAYSQLRDQLRVSLCLPALVGGFFTTSATQKALCGQGVYGKSLFFPLNFTLKLKLL